MKKEDTYLKKKSDHFMSRKNLLKMMVSFQKVPEYQIKIKRLVSDYGLHIYKVKSSISCSNLSMECKCTKFHRYSWSVFCLIVTLVPLNTIISSKAIGKYPLITYYWTSLLILDHSYLVGNLTNSKIAETRASEPLQF
jgi:hypothetical protein